MSVFNAAMRNEYENWKSNIPAVFTLKGNRKSPSHSNIIQFISNSLEKIQPETIMKSFRVCGISPTERVPIHHYNHLLKSFHETQDEIIDYHSDSDTEVDDDSFPCRIRPGSYFHCHLLK